MTSKVPIKRRLIRSFAELHDLAQTHGHDHFIYRGEDDKQYALRPKIGRQKFDNSKENLVVEKSMLHEFKRRSVSHIKHFPENEWEWLALAQHFGLATRLLDWTENLLVAAFFALMKSSKPGDRVIYVMNQTKLSHINQQDSPFEIKEVRIYRPKHLSARISAQSGLFTVHPSPEKQFRHESLERWVIKENAVIDICVVLDTFGFNKATMFPGLDGLASHINFWHGLHD